MNYEILKKKFFDTDNNLKINKDLKKIYEELLVELAEELNKIHKINWPLKSWRLLLGPWLYRYVSSLNFRTELILECQRQFANLNLEDRADTSELNLASYDLEDFSDKMLLHKYNKYLFCRIFDFINRNDNNETDRSINIKLIEKKEIKENKFSNLGNFILRILETTLCFKNNFVFYKIYVGSIFTVLNLCWKLKEVPFKYNVNEKRFYFDFNHIIRKNIFNKKDEELNINKKIIKYFLKEALPTIYLEGFQSMYNQVEKSFLPSRNIKFIYTCSLISDTLFKFWAAKKVSQGTKIVYGQHGGNTNFSKDNFKTEHELDISENFISWGWESDNKKIKKGYCFSILAKDNYKKISNSKFLLVLPPAYHFHFYNKISFFNELMNGQKEHVLASTKMNFDFLNENKKLFNNLDVRLHPNDYRTETPFKPLLEKNFKELSFDKSKKLLDSFKNYQLIIFGYLEATPFLQCLALNKPCVVITPLDKDIFTEETKRFWEKFEKIGILETNTFNLNEKIQKLGGNINNWWYSDNIQKTIKEYTNTNAYKDNKSIDRISNILSNIC